MAVDKQAGHPVHGTLPPGFATPLQFAAAALTLHHQSIPAVAVGQILHHSSHDSDSHTAVVVPDTLAVADMGFAYIVRGHVPRESGPRAIPCRDRDSCHDGGDDGH